MWGWCLRQMSTEVVVNTRFLSRTVTGVERYAREVTKRLRDRVTLLPSPRRMQGLAGHLWEQFSLPGKVDRGALLWSPANTGPLRIAKQVLTLHDMSPVDHPDWFKLGFAAWYSLLLPRLVRRIRKVITSSEFSRRRVMAICGVPEEHVAVVPCGVDPEHFCHRPAGDVRSLCLKYGIRGNYFLAIGPAGERKNLGSIFRAWEGFIGQYAGVELVVAGESGPVFQKGVTAEPPDGIRRLGYVDERQLPVLYSGAVALIYPSVYEGFGLPILEAMSCGTPVIASHSAAIPEVAGKAAVLINPNVAREMITAMQAVISQADLRQELAQRGLVHARQFSWDRTARSVWEVLEGARSSGTI